MEYGSNSIWIRIHNTGLKVPYPGLLAVFVTVPLLLGGGDPEGSHPGRLRQEEQRQRGQLDTVRDQVIDHDVLLVLL